MVVEVGAFFTRCLCVPWLFVCDCLVFVVRVVWL